MFGHDVTHCESHPMQVAATPLLRIFHTRGLGTKLRQLKVRPLSTRILLPDDAPGFISSFQTLSQSIFSISFSVA
jgi:hypothetical protein